MDQAIIPISKIQKFPAQNSYQTALYTRALICFENAYLTHENTKYPRHLIIYKHQINNNIFFVVFYLKLDLKERNWVLATNSDLLIPISFDPIFWPLCRKPLIFQTYIIWSNTSLSSKCQMSSTLDCKDIGIRKDKDSIPLKCRIEIMNNLPAWPSLKIKSWFVL